MRRARTAAIGMALALAAIAPGHCGAQAYPPQVLELVARTRTQIKTIDMAALKAAVDQRTAGLLIDVREPQEFQAGHIPRALNIPRGLVELRIWGLVGFPGPLDQGRKITLYCGSGVRCILAAKSLQDLGFTNVVAVDMRLADWAAAGYPLATD